MAKAKHWTTIEGVTIEYQIKGEIFVRKDDGSAIIEKNEKEADRTIFVRKDDNNTINEKNENEASRTILVKKDDNDETNEKNGRKAGRIPNLVKWIEKHCERGSTFNLDEYYEKYPNDKNFCTKIQKYISNMIADKKLTQISNKKFKVN